MSLKCIGPTHNVSLNSHALMVLLDGVSQKFEHRLIECEREQESGVNVLKL